MNRFKGNHWEIELLPDWLGEHDDGFAILYNPHGAGALQVAVQSKDSEVTEGDLRDLASRHVDTQARLVPAELGDFSGFSLVFQVEGVFWQHWYVSSGRHALLMTYTCGVRDKEREIGQVREMLASLSRT